MSVLMIKKSIVLLIFSPLSQNCHRQTRILLIGIRHSSCPKKNEIYLQASLFRYGYVDPLGKIREFTYQSGTPCDPKTKQPIKQPTARSFSGVSPTRASKTGYFDYSDNRFVLPDGRRVKVVVNKANRARG